ncbi:hypothetical protein LCGC14_0506610 [marine sediment metagenome]|uniref:Uncharacterized protein n=1 Tax=marine sediment metagenome TaxID=412755 RepID=A0A0F9UP17_9ZZZZ
MTKEMTYQEKRFYDNAVTAVLEDAHKHREMRPAMSTLLEEIAEAILASRGKHDDPLELEIVQIGGICINILWQLYSKHISHVNNIGTKSHSWGK